MADNALQFNSGSGLVSVPNASAFQSLTAWTAEMYINLQAVSDASFARIFDYHSGNNGFNLYFNNLSRTLSADIGNGSSSISTNFFQSVPLTTIVHVALQWDGSNAALYIAGVKDGNNPSLGGGNSGNPGISFYFGNEPAADRGTKLILDEFRLSNIARYSASFTPPTGRLADDGNTLELYHFDEGTGTTTTGTHSNVGTLSGSPLPSWVSGLSSPAISNKIYSINQAVNRASSY